MKRLLLYNLVLFICSCSANSSNEPKESNNTIPKASLVQQRDSSSTWIEHFKQFRDAVYKSNKAEIKSYFSFPVTNENNEIWYLVKEGNDINFSSNKIKPFTEIDFDRYFKKLFPKPFVESILKIKSEVLYKTGEYETIELKDGQATSYKMIASFDKADQILSLNLASNTIRKDSSGEVLDGGEFNIIYQFEILQNKKIRFKQVRLAG